jgi:hypothetical protein
MIKFNEVTWYSKLAAVILFLLVVPALTFYIGTEYQLTKDVVSNGVIELPFVKAEHPPVTSMVKNPISFYAKEIFKLDLGDKVWSFGFDINHDGREDIFVSDTTENSNDGKIGKFWTLFVNNGDGTFSVYKGDVNLSIAPSALGYATMNQDTSKSLVTYVPESADSGSLVWYNFVDGKIVSQSKKINPLGKDAAMYNKYIHNGLDHESNKYILIDEIAVSNIQ